MTQDLQQRRRQRLRQLSDDWFGGNDSALARAIGRTQSQISDMLLGRKSFGEKIARSIEDALSGPPYHLPSGWLDTVAAPESLKSLVNGPQAVDIVIQQFDTGGAMGDGLLLRDQPGVIQSWKVSPEWLSKNVRNATAARNLCIVTGFGDSMRPLFNPGDPLLVDRGVSSVEFDAIYFFRVGEEGFIKRLQRIPGKGLIALSENKSYQDWIVDPGMDFEVFGRVLKIWKGEDF
jgi:hypothetical protein